MNILFDQGTPVPLRRYLVGHTVSTAYEQGWSNVTNGELLDAAEHAGYQVLGTTDQNLRYQQNLANATLPSWCCYRPPGRAFVSMQTPFVPPLTILMLGHTAKYQSHSALSAMSAKTKKRYSVGRVATGRSATLRTSAQI